MLRLALDGTPLLGPRTGIGEVVAGLISGLAARTDLEVTAYALTWRGRHDLRGMVPAGVRAATAPIPARFAASGMAARRASAHRTVDRTGRCRALHQLRGTADAGAFGGVGLRPRIRPLPRALHRRRAPVSAAAGTRDRAWRLDPRHERRGRGGDHRDVRGAVRARRPRLSRRARDAGWGRGRRTPHRRRRPLRAVRGHHRTSEEPSRARAGVRRSGRTRSRPGARDRRHVRLGRRRVRRGPHPGTTRRPGARAGLRLRRRPARPARGRVRARVPVALRGFRVPAARGHGRGGAGGRHPGGRHSRGGRRRRPPRRSRRRRRAGRGAADGRARPRPPPGPRRRRRRSPRAVLVGADGRRDVGVVPPDRARGRRRSPARADSWVDTWPPTSPRAMSRSSSSTSAAPHHSTSPTPTPSSTASPTNVPTCCTTSWHGATSASRGATATR